MGFVQDAKYSDVKDSIPPLFFTPWPQDGNVGDINFYVRTADAAATLRSASRRRAASTRRCPSAPRRRAISAPILALAPVTTMVLG